jgi:dTMP kinase
MTKMPGKLIAVEGLDGSGKSTQLNLLHRWMESHNLKVALTNWNSSNMVKAATSKGKKRRLLTPTTFSLIHATDFADRYERLILPLLKGGYLVLADRYIYTAYVRDITRGCDPEWVKDLYDFARKPDLTLFFKLPSDVALNRILSMRPKLKYFESGMDMNYAPNIIDCFRIFQKKMNDQYLQLEEQNTFVTINGTHPIQQQQSVVRKLVKDTFDLNGFKKRGYASQ